MVHSGWKHQGLKGLLKVVYCQVVLSHNLFSVAWWLYVHQDNGITGRCELGENKNVQKQMHKNKLALHTEVTKLKFGILSVQT